MRFLISKTAALLVVFTACGNPAPPIGRSNIDWKKEWKENETRLKRLAQEVKEKKGERYHMGNNDFPGDFHYPFNEGFWISYGNRDTIVDTNKISIRFYLDRGLLDHFSAIIYTKDGNEMRELDSKVKEGGGDYKIEANWYMVND